MRKILGGEGQANMKMFQCNEQELHRQKNGRGLAGNDGSMINRSGGYSNIDIMTPENVEYGVPASLWMTRENLPAEAPHCAGARLQ
jgi:hypothetical protein